MPKTLELGPGEYQVKSPFLKKNLNINLNDKWK